MNDGTYAFLVFVSSLALCGAAGAIVIGLQWLERARRRRQLSALARELGYEYREFDDSLGYIYVTRSPNAKTWPARVRNVITGSTEGGRAVYYEFDAKGRESSVRLSACAFHGPFSFGELRVTPKIPGDILDIVHDRGIHLESAEFNGRFLVQSDNKQFAFEVLTQKTMQFLLDNPFLEMRTRGDWIWFGHAEAPSAPAAKRIISMVTDFAALLPHYLRRGECRAE